MMTRRLPSSTSALHSVNIMNPFSALRLKAPKFGILTTLLEMQPLFRMILLLLYNLHCITASAVRACLTLRFALLPRNGTYPGKWRIILSDSTGNVMDYRAHLSDSESYFVTRTDPQSAIDLGFIAKGYIADRLKEYLLSEGVESGIISLGGNILLIGSKPDGAPFQVGIQKPFGAPNEIITTVQESDISVVSSGCYERYFATGETEADRMIYHHIFDTATGCPVQNDLLGVTILSDSSMEGDALSTYCYLLGLDKGLDYIRSLDNVDAIFVTKDYEIIPSYESENPR